MDAWEPQEYIRAIQGMTPRDLLQMVTMFVAIVLGIHYTMGRYGFVDMPDTKVHAALVSFFYGFSKLCEYILPKDWLQERVTQSTPLASLVKKASKPSSKGGKQIPVQDMLLGGSGSSRERTGHLVATETVHAKYVINCAGGASDQVARLIGDDSFTIKPRVGDYLLLNRNQGHLAKHTLFPCPHPVLGKGVLVQTTLWGNLILGPTARDMHKPEARDMSAKSVQEYILSKCKALVPSFDPKETFHAFNGARAKSDRGDWIIERSAKDDHFVNVAGIDSPGLAGSPASTCWMYG